MKNQQRIELIEILEEINAIAANNPAWLYEDEDMEKYKDPDNVDDGYDAIAYGSTLIFNLSHEALELLKGSAK